MMEEKDHLSGKIHFVSSLTPTIMDDTTIRNEGSLLINRETASPVICNVRHTVNFIM